MSTMDTGFRQHDKEICAFCRLAVVRQFFNPFRAQAKMMRPGTSKQRRAT